MTHDMSEDNRRKIAREALLKRLRFVWSVDLQDIEDSRLFQRFYKFRTRDGRSYQVELAAVSNRVRRISEIL